MKVPGRMNLWYRSRPSLPPGVDLRSVEIINCYTFLTMKLIRPRFRSVCGIANLFEIVFIWRFVRFEMFNYVECIAKGFMKSLIKMDATRDPQTSVNYEVSVSGVARLQWFYGRNGPSYPLSHLRFYTECTSSDHLTPVTRYLFLHSAQNSEPIFSS